MGKHLMANMSRLATAIDTAATVMAEAVEDIKWLRERSVDPEVATMADQLADKLEAAVAGLKTETDVTNPPAEEPAPVEPTPVEEPAPVEETPVEAPVEPVTE
jgi:hypothetical protein